MSKTLEVIRKEKEKLLDGHQVKCEVGVLGDRVGIAFSEVLSFIQFSPTEARRVATELRKAALLVEKKTK